MKDRITVQEAARRLGVKDDAIRKRIQRGTLEHDKDADGRVFVYLDATQDASEGPYKDKNQRPPYGDAAQYASYSALVETLRAELEDWKAVVHTRDEELRRKDHIIAALTERIPELPPPDTLSDEREAPVSGTEEEARGGALSQEERPSWWRRWF